jgi:D-tagatose-1,6-bisphosphate aldolase subunit GatZ/KbaZ
MSPLLSLIKTHKSGKVCGVYAVCSANPLVLKAALLQAKQNQSILLVEATSNQVNQFGGYTGMQPSDFKRFLEDIANSVEFPLEKLILGGDHLGPNCWQDDCAQVAMHKSEQLINAYVSAGFEKIHLDCSMACADDELPLDDAIIAERAARLCQIAEQAYQQRPKENAHQRAPLYIIGTEVPIPGGAQEDLEPKLEVTKTEDAAKTLALHLSAFEKRNLSEAWQRVIALVVQPGVEFDHQSIIEYQPQAAQLLSQSLDSNPNLVFEAHSTDYQPPAAFHALVKDHFAILKVGPALTFALREVLFALSDIESQLMPKAQQSDLKQTIERVMLAEPKYWQSYYQGSENDQRFARQFSFSDRCRYYWPHPEINNAVDHLLANLSEKSMPVTLLSQYLPLQYQAIISGQLANQPLAIIYFHIQQVTAPYARACQMDNHHEQ